MIHHPTISGGPAGDVGLGALAAVVRFGYGMGLTDPPSSDEEAISTFAAFLVGAGAPAAPRERSC